MGRRRGRGGAARPADLRVAAGGLLVALGVRPQRRVVGAGPGRDAALCARVGRPGHSAARCRGRGAGRSRAVRPGVFGDRGARARLARHADRGRPGPGGGPARRLHDVGATPEAPPARPARLSQPVAVVRKPVDLRAVLRVLRVRVHDPPIPAARARRHAPARGAPGPADGAGADADSRAWLRGSPTASGRGGCVPPASP